MGTFRFPRKASARSVKPWKSAFLRSLREIATSDRRETRPRPVSLRYRSSAARVFIIPSAFRGTLNMSCKHFTIGKTSALPAAILLTRSSMRRVVYAYP